MGLSRLPFLFQSLLALGPLLLVSCTKMTSAPPANPAAAQNTTYTFDVTDYGADKTCVTDATGAINAALAAAAAVNGVVRIPAGCFLVSDALTLPARTADQQATFHQVRAIVGDGADTTVIKVSTSFNLSAAGVFVLKENQLYTHGARLEGLSIVFTQPDSSNLADLTHYPVAINIDGASSSVIKSVNIWDAWDGISAKGTFNGSTYIPDASSWKVQNVAMTAYHIGIDQDGSWNTIVIDDFHFHFNHHDWGKNPATVNQKMSIFSDNAIAIRTGNADDIKISNSILAGLTALSAGPGAINGGAYIEVSNTSFDFGTSIVWTNRRQLQISNSNFFLADVSAGQTLPMIGATMGNILINNCYFNSSSTRAGRHMIDYTPNSTGMFSNYSLSVTNSTFNAEGGAANQGSPINLNVGAAALLTANINNNNFYRSGAVVYTKALIGVANAGYLSMTVQGNSFLQDAGATGYWIAIDNDGPYYISGNVFNSTLTSSYPGVRPIGTYQ